jgi:hypothetical protein
MPAKPESVLVRLVNRRDWSHVWTGRFAAVPAKGHVINVGEQGWIVDPHPDTIGTDWHIEPGADEAALVVELRRCGG